ncbi:MAG: hypothetical protein QOH34_1234, partial [Mycobacterium sp.]|nr:hypothetical protein [Mycobacterium sp.]
MTGLTMLGSGETGVHRSGLSTL